MSLPLITFSPLARIRCERIFSVPSRVLVLKGQQVEVEDVIAQAILEPRHLSLDLAYSLGLPGRDIERYLQFGVGAVISQGDVLAGPVGYSKRVVRAPVAGKIIRIEQGELVMQVAAQPESLKAGIPAEVVELVEERGAVLELIAALVQGVWGNGRRAYARFVCLAASPEDQLTINTNDERLADAILVGGPCRDPDSIHAAQAVGAAGLLISSLDAGLYHAALRASIPVVVLEGFGSHPLPPPVFELLGDLSGQSMMLDARLWDRTRNSRPEAILPRMTSEASPSQAGADSSLAHRDVSLYEIGVARRDLGLIHPGQAVRLVGDPYHGARGKLVDLPGPSRFANGIPGLGARVRLDSPAEPHSLAMGGDEILLPLTNLEFIG